jgi:hypothetical protein
MLAQSHTSDLTCFHHHEREFFWLTLLWGSIFYSDMFPYALVEVPTDTLH